MEASTIGGETSTGRSPLGLEMCLLSKISTLLGSGEVQEGGMSVGKGMSFFFTWEGKDENSSCLGGGRDGRGGLHHILTPVPSLKALPVSAPAFELVQIQVTPLGRLGCNTR